MALAYTSYTNLDAGFLRLYERGDRLVRGYTGVVDVEEADDVGAVAERVFARHSRDDVPTGSCVRRCQSVTSS
jgi:hypothetical protein